MADAGRWLARAASLAAGSAPDVLPNPPVGCVLLGPDGTVVGEGFHGAYGGPHAEAEALRAAGPLARGATAFLTLEPCAAGGPGKKTPACAGALLAAGVAGVVYACDDPWPDASGKGPALLRAAGVEARREASPEAEALIPRYRRAVPEPVPWTIAKWAMTLDGKTADARGGSRWISGEAARARVHELRARCDAVVVGARTAVLDDPDLRPRGVPGAPRAPLRVVVDESLRLGPGARLAATAREAPVLVAAGARAPAARRAALEALGVEIGLYPGTDGRVDLEALFRALRARGVRRLLLEGGGELVAAVFRLGLVRQVAAFVAPSILGGRPAPTAVAGEEGLRTADRALRLEETRVTRLGEDVLIEGFV